MGQQIENRIVTIGETNLPVIEYHGNRIVTFEMVDQVHQRPEGTARKRFNDHQSKLIEDDYCYRLIFHEVSSLSEFRTAGILANSQGLIVLTESGFNHQSGGITPAIGTAAPNQSGVNLF